MHAIKIIHPDILTRTECMVALEVSGLAAGIQAHESFDSIQSFGDGDLVIAGQAEGMPRLVRDMRRLLKAHPNVRAIALLSALDVAAIPLLVRAGVHGFVLEDATTRDITPAVRTLADHGGFISVALLEACAGAPGREGRGRAELTLTLREQEILGLIASGQSNKAIARRLDLSVRTVETHRLNIRKKTGARDRRGLVRVAGQLGLMPSAGGEYPTPTHAAPGRLQEE